MKGEGLLLIYLEKTKTTKPSLNFIIISDSILGKLYDDQYVHIRCFTRIIVYNG